MELRFWKYEGTGNDFILIDGRESVGELRADTIRHLCDRHRGIGADGLMILLSRHGVDFRMRYFNADGSEAAMCGNGGRCMTLFADHLGIGGDEKVFVGLDGEHRSRILSRSGDSAMIELGMINVDGFEYGDRAFYLNTGVPHYVEFVDNVDSVDVYALGHKIRNDERFSAGGGTNVNFVEITGEGAVKIRTYERGVEAETLACGTGATAAAIATHLYDQNNRSEFMVYTPGGALEVRFTTDDDQHFRDITLTGPAGRIFEGSIKLP